MTRTQAAMAELKEFFSGPRPVGDSAVPPIVFVMANAVSGLTVAATAAVAVAVALMGYRIARGRPAIYALGGVAGVGFAVFLALRSNQAEGYFLPGIVSSAGWAVVALTSAAVRRPAAVYTSWAVHRWPMEWYRRSDIRPAYTEVTLAWGLFFAVRAAIQYRLFDGGNVTALGLVKVATGTPAVIVMLIGTYLYGTWRLEKLGGPTADEYLAGAEPSGEHRKL
ncbi:MAG: DUF3159 domain-containing protein [Acidimicrobiia bacterium]|nr:DUF3159 domain-containing protein [Acidimicrobiia bacterium]